jgi:PKD repeat protein
VAGFTYSQANKNSPVIFNSTSTPTSGSCAISYWRWEFGDGTIDAGNLSTASHDYGNKHRGESFTVTLSVTNPGGTVTHWIIIVTKS